MRQRLYRRRDDDGVLHNVDLHWAISNSARERCFSARTLMARAVPVAALGPHARAPVPVDALLIACLHLDAHHPGEARLIWLYDVHLLVQRLGAGERRTAAAAAAATGLAPACAWVLALARERLGTPMQGLEPLAAAAPLRRPSSRRVWQWLRALRELPDTATRLAWLAQHARLPPDPLRRDQGRPLPVRHLLRLLRGVRHLASR
jgi:hypothetical protein